MAPLAHDVLVLGDVNPDLVLTGDVVPRFGQAEQLLTGADLLIGGSGAITAHGMARLGLDVALVAEVGDDVVRPADARAARGGRSAHRADQAHDRAGDRTVGGALGRREPQHPDLSRRHRRRPAVLAPGRGPAAGTAPARHLLLPAAPTRRRPAPPPAPRPRRRDDDQPGHQPRPGRRVHRHRRRAGAGRPDVPERCRGAGHGHGRRAADHRPGRGGHRAGRLRAHGGGEEQRRRRSPGAPRRQRAAGRRPGGRPGGHHRRRRHLRRRLPLGPAAGPPRRHRDGLGRRRRTPRHPGPRRHRRPAHAPPPPRRPPPAAGAGRQKARSRVCGVGGGRAASPWPP